MSFLDKSAAAGYNALMGQQHQHLAQQANQTFNNAYNQYSGMTQQQMLLYNQQQYQRAMMNQETPWKFNGKHCSIREMADMIWANDCAEKTHFLLKYE